MGLLFWVFFFHFKSHLFSPFIDVLVFLCETLAHFVDQKKKCQPCKVTHCWRLSRLITHYKEEFEHCWNWPDSTENIQRTPWDQLQEGHCDERQTGKVHAFMHMKFGCTSKKAISPVVAERAKLLVVHQLEYTFEQAGILISTIISWKQKMCRPTSDKLHPTKQACSESSVVLCWPWAVLLKLQPSIWQRQKKQQPRAENISNCNTNAENKCATVLAHYPQNTSSNKTKRLLPGAVGHKRVKSMPVKPKVINYGFQSSQTNCRKRREKNREEQNAFNQSCLRCAFCFLIVNLNTVSLARTGKWSYCKIPGRLLTRAANSLPS